MQLTLFYWGVGLTPNVLGTKSTDVPHWSTQLDLHPHLRSTFPRASKVARWEIPPYLGLLSTRKPLIFYPKLGSEALCVHGSQIITSPPREDAAPSRRPTPRLTVSSVVSLPVRTPISPTGSQLMQK